MDLLFREYASPFSLLDELISVGRLNDFLDVFSQKQEEKTRWELYIHKLGAFDTRSWGEFNRDLDKGMKKSSVKQILVPTKEELETTIKHSYAMFKHFEIPQKGG